MINWKTYSWLYDHYVNQQLSIKKISKLVSKSDVYVGMVMREHNIPIRTIAEERRNLHLVDVKTIIKLYEAGESVEAVARVLGISMSVVVDRLKLNNVKMRTRAQSRRLALNRQIDVVPYDKWANKKWLTEHYIKQFLSINDIGKCVGWSYGAVRQAMIKFDIRLRSISDAMKLRSKEISRLQEDNWRKPDYRSKMFEIFAARPKVSGIQNRLYEFLDEFGVEYFREYNDRDDDSGCRIGSWSFDCVVPRDDYTLLIEVQGDYYHSLPQNVARDIQKANYVKSQLAGYRLKYLWEYQFDREDYIRLTLKQWLGLIQVNEFSFGEVTISNCEYNSFFDKYHYAGSIGRPVSYVFGAYLDNVLIAVACFTSPIRQNVSVAGFNYNELTELARLCIHPEYQKHNFASWFVARCIKRLPSQYRCVIAYSDQSFGHDGTIYKASNFVMDHITQSSYSYFDGIDHLHKKTLYNRAKRAHMSEGDYARKNGYRKIKSMPKFRYVYKCK